MSAVHKHSVLTFTQVFDEEADPDTSISEKTVTLSVAEGISGPI